MWNRINLRTRIYLILAALIGITFIGGLVMVWYTYRMERLLTAIIDRDAVGFETAEALETALVNQKGFVSYYFLDGDPAWLRQLGEYRQIFKERMEQADRLAQNSRQKEAIGKIEAQYARYIREKDTVIAYYKAGRREIGSRLHQQVRDLFFSLLALCEEYKNIHKARILQARAESQIEAQQLRAIAVFGMILDLFLAVMLVFILVHHILGPLHRLRLEADRQPVPESSPNEIKDLSRSVRGLLENVDQTRSALEKSREHLLQAEKMAMVGKLAAGMAHSIRNPFTSVKMRLFSLSRSLELNPVQQEDFDVISQEIRHIDTIVQNFLEFSRPPRLKMQLLSPSAVVDMALQLLHHRLRSYDVHVKVIRRENLPRIEGDAEQLKEVLVNLMVNACEAMEEGGAIEIREREVIGGPLAPSAQIRIADTGPGIPQPLAEKVFLPFFTTKEEGTGLGLSIAARIIQEHGGHLELDPEPVAGTCFVITLPVKE